MTKKRLESVKSIILFFFFLFSFFFFTNNSFADECQPPETGTHPDCGECTAGQIGAYPDCIDAVCEPPQTGEYPICYDPCPSGQSRNLDNVCVCDNGGNLPYCTYPTYCCDDPIALNYDDTCPDEPDEEASSEACEFCTPESTDPSCVVTYCPTDVDEPATCQANNPNMNCVSSYFACTYYYCDDPEANNRDENGAACMQAHQGSTCTRDDPNECEYDPVYFCDNGQNPNATNGQTQTECDNNNYPHPCEADNSVCTYNPAVLIPYCNHPDATNYDPLGAQCTAANDNPDNPNVECRPNVNSPVCTFDNICQSLLEVAVACESGFTYEGEFTHSYTYTAPDICQPPNQQELNILADYLEGRICGSGSGAEPAPSNIDWCSEIVGVQTDPTDCPIDVCSYDPGVQTTESECSDICSDVSGPQSVVPAGRYRNEDGTCPFIDICPNLSGNQANLPENHYFNNSGDCVNGGVNLQYSAECSVLAGSYINSASSISASNACSTGIFGNYIAFNPNANPDSYNWQCFGIGLYSNQSGAVASCFAYQGNMPICGSATSSVYELNYNINNITGLCSSGQVSDLDRSETILINSSNPPMGEGTIDWECNYGSVSTSCSAYSTGCLTGTSYCPASRTCEASLCPPFGVELTSNLKTTEIINKDQPCVVYVEETISTENSNTLCTLKNLTDGMNISTFTNFKPGDVPATYSLNRINRDTVFQLTCGQDSEDTGIIGVLDASEAQDPVIGSCRLNIKSTEFN